MLAATAVDTDARLTSMLWAGLGDLAPQVRSVLERVDPDVEVAATVAAARADITDLVVQGCTPVTAPGPNITRSTVNVRISAPVTINIESARARRSTVWSLRPASAADSTIV